MVLQQQAPDSDLSSNRTPMTVKAILAQETSHQANTMTKTDSRIPQQHGDIIIPFNCFLSLWTDALSHSVWILYLLPVQIQCPFCGERLAAGETAWKKLTFF
jgi:hypothetical protein